MKTQHIQNMFWYITNAEKRSFKIGRPMKPSFIWNAVFLFAIIFFFHHQIGFAQRSITTKSGASMRIYSPEDGIPSNNITNAFVTKNGFLWLSTSGGTVRISGHEVEDFGADMGIPLMRHIHYDRNNEVIWLTNNETLIKFSGAEIQRYDAVDGFNPPGMANKEVFSMFADSIGRLWLGSFSSQLNIQNNGGLTLFEDGRFSVIPKETLPLHNIVGIYNAKDGSLWFTSSGYNGDGYSNNEAWMAQYKDGEFKIFDTLCPCTNVNIMFREPEGLKPSIIEDNQGNMWFYCSGRTSSSTWEQENHGLYRYDGKTFEASDWVNSHLINGSSIYEMRHDEKKDEIFVMLRRNMGFGIREISEMALVYRNGQWQFETIVTPDQMRELLHGEYNADELLYVQAFLHQYGDEGLLVSYLCVERTTGRWFGVVFLKEADGWKWMDTTPGIIFMNVSDKTFLTVNPEPDVLGFYTPPKSRLLTTYQGLLKAPVEGGQLFTDNQGNVWLNYMNRWDSVSKTWNAVGISKWDGENITNFTIDDGFAGNQIFKPIQASDGAVWFPTNNGVTRLTANENDYQIESFFGPNGNQFRASTVLEKPNGDIYAWQGSIYPKSTEHPGFDYFFGKFNGHSFDPIKLPYPDSLTALPYQAYELSADRDNRLWMNARFADTENGLNTAISHILVEENDEWFDPSKQWQIPDTRLFLVGELHNGIYYIVNGGFYKFDFDVMRFINLSDSTNATADFTILKRVNTWSLHFNIVGKDHLYIRFRDMGIALFDGINLNYLDRRNGLPSLRLLYPNNDPEGRVYFATPFGGIIFDGKEYTTIKDEAVTEGNPRAITRDKNNNILILYQGLGLTVTQQDTTRYPVRISSIKVDSLYFFEGQSVKLRSRQNNIDFRFATLNFANPENTSFSFKLDGQSSDWSKPSKVNFTEYRNLPPGDYTFRLRGVSMGKFFSDEAVFYFSIAPPWWQTTIAYLIYGFIAIGGFLLINRFMRQRAIALEREKARERELEQAREIEKAYKELKATQEQLIQSEKLASLGQLTAGIAHEIQNPLNFVNNFSEVSRELIDEMMEELADGSGKKAEGNGQLSEEKMKLVEEIANDIKQNLEKINHHGKRADAIVKGMLQHSRATSGQKEPTDLNSLADEYLRLSYHGLRAKDKNFNADFKTDFDPDLPIIKVIPQDIGRVLLNLINNAFYAVDQRAKTLTGFDTLSGFNDQETYKPTVTVATKNLGDRIQISVMDNGSGIPEEIKHKIFQPFFTTKPTGKGTGLGLSLSYDIVKAHGGEIKLESISHDQEKLNGQESGTTFIIRLPAA